MWRYYRCHFKNFVCKIRSLFVLSGLDYTEKISVNFWVYPANEFVPVEAKIIGYHISYQQDFPAAISNYCGGLYIVATIVPPFFSRIRRMWMFGATILISYIITKIFYTDFIVSVWCFFASVISIAVFAILYELNNPNKIISTSAKDNITGASMVT